MLLGAGASIEAGVPGAFAMTEKISSSLRTNERFGKQAHVLSYVVGGLLFEVGRNNIDPLAPAINVEDLFNAVQLLAERDTLEAAPFINSWHSFIDELDKIYPSQPSGNLQRLIYETVSKQILAALSQNPPAFGASKVDEALISAVQKLVEASVKNRRPSLTPNASVGRAVERYVQDLTKKWSSKLKSPTLLGQDKIERQITKQIEAAQAHSGQGRIFHETNELMIAALKDLVWIEDANKITYLAPLLNMLEKQERLVIATLNYDNSVELLSESQNIECKTGISEWSTSGRFTLTGAGLHLLKLHGSIDWLREENEFSYGKLPVITIRQLASQEVKRYDLRPAVIFGNRNKLTAEGPFLDLLRAFQDELTRSRTLTVVGYSFRDPHINVYISQWLNGDSKRVLRIVNGPSFSQEARFVSGTPTYVHNLFDFASINPHQVHIIGEYAGIGLQQLYGERDIAVPQPSLTVNQPALERIAEEVELEDEPIYIEEFRGEMEGQTDD